MVAPKEKGAAEAAPCEEEIELREERGPAGGAPVERDLGGFEADRGTRRAGRRWVAD